MVTDYKMFLRFPPSRQAEYLNQDDFLRLSRKEKIDFLKAILKEDLTSEVTIRALSLLKEFNYTDRYFFRKFLYSRDADVVAVARQAINQLQWKDNLGITVEDMLREGKSDDRILLADYFLAQEGKINEDALLDFLRVNDIKVRDVIVQKVTPDHQVDDALLSAAINRGTAWYVRAALVEILGNRKSQHLLDCIEYLMNDNNVEVKLKLIDALLKLGMEKGKVYLEQLARDSIIWVRKQAHRALLED